MKAVRAFAQFWYDFIIGDDWKIACGVAVALFAIAALLVWGGASASVVCVVGALLVATAFTLSVVVDGILSRRE